jgi:alkylation response protein AidB-like acyl-CoA dehydrogenase
MDLRDSGAEREFRQALRRWLETNAPEILVGDEEARAEALIAWHRKLYDAGYLGLDFPKEAGGQGLSPIYEAILNEEVGLAGAPPLPSISYLGKAVLHYGSEEQRRTVLPGLLSGRTRWCQGFSEPGAGSDLAALQTRASRDGDDFIVTGQKVWTSEASHADWMMLLARSEPEAPKHRGLSFFLVPMESQGIEVRPVVQMNGGTEFNEVFMDGVRVAAKHMLGEPGQGWQIAMTMLEYERGPADSGFSSRYQSVIARLEREFARRDEVTVGEHEELGRAFVAIEVLRTHVLRSLSARLQGGRPGAEGSIDKLLQTRTEQELHHIVMDLLEPRPLLEERSPWLYEYLYSRGQSIMGGTAQIQRNIVAQRVLGLPRS